MALIYAYQSRGLQKDITIQDAAGDTVTPSASDRIRATIGRIGGTALLTVDSLAATSNGSSFTKGAANRLRLAAADLALIDPGTYTIQFDYFDSDDGPTGAWLVVDRQVFRLEVT